ncbi:MAG: flagellar protein FlgN [Lachnospiraceae bacterium]|jgi:flagellar biosynthesis/type III secretory pathway chaperone|nr:flagellar protein FlgN [Lachnospiraceae bacterium]
MASLVDTLIDVLNREDTEYRQIIELSSRKTQAIVKGDIDELEHVTDDEQLIVDRINACEKERASTMKEIAKILNTDVSGLKLSVLISLLDKSPKEQKALAKIHDKLHETLHEVKLINERNEELLNSAREMVDFNLTLIQSMRKAPETANYNRGAYNTGSTMGSMEGGFDAKQ